MTVLFWYKCSFLNIKGASVKITDDSQSFCYDDLIGQLKDSHNVKVLT